MSEIGRVAGRAVGLHDDPAASARAAGLRHVSDQDPGLTRIRCGRGFRYRDARGRPAAARQVERIRSLAIPPAWTDVWICLAPDGHLQATGLDDRGRRQYLYHPQWRRLRDAATFDRLSVVGSVLPELRAAVAGQMRRRTVDRERVLAGMAHTLDLTAMRVGNEVYERDNASIGLATLCWRHVSRHKAVTMFRFPAKSGRAAKISVSDTGLARLLDQIEGTPRCRVFSEGGRVVRPDELNGYLAEIAGVGVTAKDFRTWRGTVTALAYLRSLPAGDRPTRRRALAAIDAAAAALGNTRAVARAHYVHPGLVECYLDGSLDGRNEATGSEGLDPAERALARILPTLGRCPG